jgi:hypoxanthine phosphoribosyltransferase
MSVRIVTMLSTEQIAARVRELGETITREYTGRPLALEHADENEDVIIVEDIVDTGLTIAHLIDLLRTRQPRSVKVCSLLHKPARAKVVVNIDYLGFTIEDKFVVGYGLDFAEKYRNLPYIGIVERT